MAADAAGELPGEGSDWPEPSDLPLPIVPALQVEE